MRTLEITIVLISILVGSAAVADECTDACDGIHQTASAVCDSLLDYGQYNCGMALLSWTYSCDWDLDGCLKYCGGRDGNPYCVNSCYESWSECRGPGFEEHVICMSDVDAEYATCISTAATDSQTCYADCFVPVVKRGWAEIKARYR